MARLVQLHTLGKIGPATYSWHNVSANKLTMKPNGDFLDTSSEIDRMLVEQVNFEHAWYIFESILKYQIETHRHASSVTIPKSPCLPIRDILIIIRHQPDLIHHIHYIIRVTNI